MRVVTVARKPCSEGTVTGNVLVHAAGALCIGRCRVGNEEITQHGRKAKSGTGWEDHWHNELESGASWTGRWPANVVLVHRSGCEIVGERRVATGTAVRRNVGHSTKGLISYAQGSKDAEMRDDVSYADADGKEAVPDWQCEGRCPVGVMGMQSGIRKTTWISPGHQNNRDGAFLGEVGHPGQQG
jgi:hypothetical protein